MTISKQKCNNSNVVLFEVYGTLLDTDTPISYCQEVLGSQADRLAELWHAKRTEYILLRNVIERFTDFWHITGEALDYALARLSIKDPILRSRLMQAYLRLKAFPEAKNVLAALRSRGIRTAALSNGSTTMLTAAINSAGLKNSLDAVLSADQVKMFKPASALYQVACEYFGLKPAQMVFVSAETWDVAGGAAFGMRTIWLNRNGWPQEKMPGQIEAEVTSLTAILAYFTSVHTSM